MTLPSNEQVTNLKIHKVPDYATWIANYGSDKDIKPEDIVLVNFYGNKDNSTCKYNGHNWDFEDEWLQDKQRLFI